MKRLLVALSVLFVLPAQAQMDAELGIPLPIRAMPSGSISVRVVDGTVEKPIPGLQVQVVGNDKTSKSARTDSEGRARVAGLKPGVEYVAKTTAGDKELATETFSVPSEGGLAFMLSPVALKPSGGGAAAAAPHGGEADSGGDQLPPIMREPRRISGRARPEQKDPPGKLTIRAVQGKFKTTDAGIVSEFPPGGNIHLVEFSKTGTVAVRTEVLDDEGRVAFAGLPRSSSYYAMAVFDRANGIKDRVMSQAVQVFPQVGSRMLLAGEARDSDAPAIDDTLQFGDREKAPGPGTVIVHVDASADQLQNLSMVKQVELFQVGKDEPIAVAPAQRFKPAPADILGRAGQLPQTSPGLAAGQVEVLVIRMSTRRGLPGMKVTIREAPAASPAPAPDGAPAPAPDGAPAPAPDGAPAPAPAPAPDGAPAPAPDGAPAPVPDGAFEQITGERGVTAFKQLLPGKKYVIAADIHGKVIESAEFEVDPAKPKSFAFAVDWPSEQVRTATFAGVPIDPDAVLYTRIRAGARELLSAPFQMTDAMGASVSLILYPQILFGFHGGGDVDDQKVWFEMRVSLANTGQTPLDFGNDGLKIPLPKGFVGGSVADEMAMRVKVVPDEGLLWDGTLPPGQKDFNVTFGIPVEGGTAEFDMALPFGLRSGSLMLGDHPGVKYEGIPSSIEPTEKQMNGRTFKVFSGLSIAPQQRLVFRMTGLPQPPPWKSWLRIGVGGFVLLLLSWGLFGIFARRQTVDAVTPARRTLERKREGLLDQLVRLESQNRKHKVTKAQYDKQKSRLMKQLESVFEELGEGE